MKFENLIPIEREPGESQEAWEACLIFLFLSPINRSVANAYKKLSALNLTGFSDENPPDNWHEWETEYNWATRARKFDNWMGERLSIIESGKRRGQFSKAANNHWENLDISRSVQEATINQLLEAINTENWEDIPVRKLRAIETLSRSALALQQASRLYWEQYAEVLAFCVEKIR